MYIFPDQTKLSLCQHASWVCAELFCTLSVFLTSKLQSAGTFALSLDKWFQPQIRAYIGFDNVWVHILLICHPLMDSVKSCSTLIWKDKKTQKSTLKSLSFQQLYSLLHIVVRFQMRCYCTAAQKKRIFWKISSVIINSHPIITLNICVNFSLFL